MTREEGGKGEKGERVNGEARPAAGTAVFGACRACELAVTVCATGEERRGGKQFERLG